MPHTVPELFSLARGKRGDAPASWKNPDLQIAVDELMASDDWYTLPECDVLARLGTPSLEAGLSETDVPPRRAAFGVNGLEEGKIRSPLAIIAQHVFSVITLILGGVFIIGVVNREWVETAAVVLVILVNVAIGAYQEISSEASMAAIRHLASSSVATVVRDGVARDVPIVDLVLGDVVVLRHGQQVPADVRLLATTQLEIDEAVLTGEAMPVLKTVEAMPLVHQLALPDAAPVPVVAASPPPSLALGNRTNIAFRRTGVTRGTGHGVVVAVGRHSQIGKIASRLANSAASKSPMTVTMERLMYLLLVLGVVAGVFIFWAFHWRPTSDAFLYASATLVAILPEAVIVLITATMAIGARRMAAQHAIVRNLGALEQLGRVTDICSDKTGTLTVGSMRPARLAVYVAPHGRAEGGAAGTGRLDALAVVGPAMSSEGAWLRVPGRDDTAVDLAQWRAARPHRAVAVDSALLVAGLCASLRLEPTVHGTVLQLVGTGNPTELALQELVQKALHHLPGAAAALWPAWAPRGEWAFNSTVKRMSMGFVHRGTGASVCLVKGAPERVVELCDNLSDAGRDLALAAATVLAQDGLRVLALARRDDLDLAACPLHELDRDTVECRLQFVGLVAVRDPPKKESAPAIHECTTAGITVRMLTGDHRETAVAIAREIGILPARGALPPGMVLTGPQLDIMTDAELDSLPDMPLVVARSSPESKVKIVESLQRRGRVVAMTGDGVNDSPAIKEADVGVAMGITGSDVTKGVADIVLADDNFATIVEAVREGRRIFDSIGMFVMHLLTGNIAEGVCLLVGLSFLRDGDDLPVYVLSPLAILFLNVGTATGPAIGLAMDPAAPDLMLRPPVRRNFFTLEFVVDAIFFGLLMAAGTLAAFALSFFAGQDGDVRGTVRCNTKNTVACHDIQRARGVAFLTLNTLLLLHAYNCRHPRLSLFAFPLFRNRVITLSILVGTLVLLPILYAPVLSADIFKHRGFDWEWGMLAAIAVLYLGLAEAYKATKRRLLAPLLSGAAPLRDDTNDTNDGDAHAPATAHVERELSRSDSAGSLTNADLWGDAPVLPRAASVAMQLADFVLGVSSPAPPVSRTASVDNDEEDLTLMLAQAQARADSLERVPSQSHFSPSGHASSSSRALLRPASTASLAATTHAHFEPPPLFREDDEDGIQSDGDRDGDGDEDGGALQFTVGPRRHSKDVVLAAEAEAVVPSPASARRTLAHIRSDALIMLSSEV